MEHDRFGARGPPRALGRPDIVSGGSACPYDDAAGWTTMPRLLATEEITSVLTGCAELLELPPTERLAGDKPSGGTRHLVRLGERLPLVDRIAGRLSLMAVVEQILGPAERRCEVSYRSPRHGFGGQRLHADDVPKLDRGPNRVATAIVALVDFTATNGATRLIPGSHRRPDLQRWAGRIDRRPDEILLTGPAGSAFVFSGHALHAGSVNRSGTERPALQLVWRAGGERAGEER